MKIFVQMNLFFLPEIRVHYNLRIFFISFTLGLDRIWNTHFLKDEICFFHIICFWSSKTYFKWISIHTTSNSIHYDYFYYNCKWIMSIKKLNKREVNHLKLISPKQEIKTII